jgi:hypothetical protein
MRLLQVFSASAMLTDKDRRTVIAAVPVTVIYIENGKDNIKQSQYKDNDDESCIF